MSLVIEGTNVYLKEYGSTGNSPILFLHGAPDSAEMWSGVIEHLKDHYHCFALDLPGFGRSTAAAGFKCDLDNMAHFIDTFVQEAGIPTPLHLVAADFGATYGLSWAVEHPQQVKRIALVGGSNFSSRYHWHGPARLLRTPVLGEALMSMMSLSLQERTMRQNAPLVSPEYVREAYTLSLGKADTRRMMLKLYRSINAQDFAGREERLQALTTHVPTLVLWGDKDPFIKPEYAEQFGSAQVEHFPQNGHWLALESPDEVAQRLDTFFA